MLIRLSCPLAKKVYITFCSPKGGGIEYFQLYGVINKPRNARNKIAGNGRVNLWVKWKRWQVLDPFYPSSTNPRIRGDEKPGCVITFTRTLGVYNVTPLHRPFVLFPPCGCRDPLSAGRGWLVSLFVLLETAPQVARRGSSRAAFYSPKWFARPAWTVWRYDRHFPILIFSLLTFNKYTRSVRGRIDGTRMGE